MLALHAHRFGKGALRQTQRLQIPRSTFRLRLPASAP
jgi:hypothetical protein